jgi:hypothetical protein
MTNIKFDFDKDRKDTMRSVSMLSNPLEIDPKIASENQALR